MNKAELIDRLSTNTQIPRRDVEAILDAFEETVKETLRAGGDVTLTGFGTFSVRKRESRMGVNPQKPTEKIRIPTVMVSKFKAGKVLKDALKTPAPSSEQAPE